MIEIKKPEPQDIAILQDEIMRQQALIDYLIKKANDEPIEKDEQE